MDAIPSPPPRRQLDTVTVEGLDDLVAADSPGRALVKSRDFPELYGLNDIAVKPNIVLYDRFSVDSFAACVAARSVLKGSAKYVGVDRGASMETLPLVISGDIVAMLGVSWEVESMHDLVQQCEWLLVLETNTSIDHTLEGFKYPNCMLILEPDMGAAALTWNLFRPQEPVPALLRALEDKELGRSLLRDSVAFARGFDSAIDLEIPSDEVLYHNRHFEDFDLLLDGGGRSTIRAAVEEGLALGPQIDELCREAVKKRVVQTMQLFPAWRCALLNLDSPFADSVADHLAAVHAEEGGAPSRCFAAVFEVRQRGVRVVLRSMPGGPDVSVIAALYGGGGRPTRGFFSVPLDSWEELWVLPETILWDVAATAPHCLGLKQGDLVTVVRRGERFRESPHDEWSWAYRTDDPTVEGWIPTLAHTLFVATRSVTTAAPGTQKVEEGDLLVARGQRGQYVWGSVYDPKGAGEGPKGWFPLKEATLQPVHAASVRRVLSGAGA